MLEQPINERETEIIREVVSILLDIPGVTTAVMEHALKHYGNAPLDQWSLIRGGRIRDIPFDHIWHHVLKVVDVI